MCDEFLCLFHRDTIFLLRSSDNNTDSACPAGRTKLLLIASAPAGLLGHQDTDVSLPHLAIVFFLGKWADPFNNMLRQDPCPHGKSPVLLPREDPCIEFRIHGGSLLKLLQFLGPRCQKHRDIRITLPEDTCRTGRRGHFQIPGHRHPVPAHPKTAYAAPPACRLQIPRYLHRIGVGRIQHVRRRQAQQFPHHILFLQPAGMDPDISGQFPEKLFSCPGRNEDMAFDPRFPAQVCQFASF